MNGKIPVAGGPAKAKAGVAPTSAVGHADAGADADSDANAGADADLRYELILRCVECIPVGHAVSYGDIAAIVGTGPRQVGRVLALYGSGTPWWRVTNARGGLPSHLHDAARRHWVNEGLTFTSEGTFLRLARHRPDLARLAADWEDRVRDIASTTLEP